jgi:signal transduction histidine kinase
LDNSEIISKIDSLYREAEKIKHDENVRALQLADEAKELSEEINYEKGKFLHLIISGYSHFLKEELEKSREHFQTALDYFTTTNDEPNVAASLRYLGQIDYKTGSTKEGLKKYYRALEIQTKHKNEFEIAHLHSNIATMFKEIAEYGKAFEHYQKSISIFKKLNDKEAVIKTYDNLAVVHLKLQNFDEALKIRMNVLKDIDSIKNIRTKMTLLANIALILNFMKRYDESLEYYDQAIAISNKLNDVNTHARLLNNIAAMKREQGETVNALEAFQEASEIFLKQNDYSNYANAVMNIGNIHKEEGRHKKAEEFYKIVEDISVKNEYTDKLRNLYYNLGDLHAHMNSHKTALEYFRKYMELQNKIYVDNVKAQLEHLETVHQIDNLQAEAEFAKQKNMELTAINNQLEDKNDQLNILLSEKNEFISIATHDLRNPLNNVIGLSQLLKEDNEKILDSESLENLDYVIESSTQMLEIIENILSDRSLSSGTINPNFKNIDINEVIEEIINLYHFKSEQKRIALIYNKPDELIILYMDSFILHQILDNILSNAIKFSPFDKKIEVTLASNEHHISISIKDEGPGFSKEDKEKVFIKYSKLSARPTGGESSSGLGLSIVKKLCDVINADISLNSEEGKGAEFILTIKKSA